MSLARAFNSKRLTCLNHRSMVPVFANRVTVISMITKADNHGRVSRPRRLPSDITLACAACHALASRDDGLRNPIRTGFWCGNALSLASNGFVGH